MIHNFGVVFITAGIFGLAIGLRTETLPLISVRHGEPQIIVPCHSLVQILPSSVRSVEWTKVTLNSNNGVYEGTVAWYFTTNVTSTQNGGMYKLSDNYGLVITDPTSMDSARYVCNATDTSGVVLTSSVDLHVTEKQPTVNTDPIHHYIVPAIIVFLVVVESAFIAAMWLNLRKARAASAISCPEGLESDLQERRQSAVDERRGEADTSPWKTVAGKWQAVLLDELNDGALLGRRDSGYEDKLSDELSLEQRGNELV